MVWQHQRNMHKGGHNMVGKQFNHNGQHWQFLPDGFCSIHQVLKVRVSLEDNKDTYGTFLRDNTQDNAVDFCWVPDQANFFVTLFSEFFSSKVVSSVLAVSVSN